MFKLWASIKKDWLILMRDKMGLALMFIMPIVLAIVIASVQNSTYELVNDKKIPLLVLNKDTAAPAAELEAALNKSGMFIIKKLEPSETDSSLKQRMQDKEALLGLIIPETYSDDVLLK